MTDAVVAGGTSGSTSSSATAASRVTAKSSAQARDTSGQGEAQPADDGGSGQGSHLTPTTASSGGSVGAAGGVLAGATGSGRLAQRER